MERDELSAFSATAREHAQHPRHYGPLSYFNGHARLTGTCGETMEFWIMANEGRIDEVAFTTDGCGSSRACGSMVAVLAVGASAEDSDKFDPRFILDSLGGIPTTSEHCATLAIKTLTAACDDYTQRRNRGAKAREEDCQEIP